MRINGWSNIKIWCSRIMAAHLFFDACNALMIAVVSWHISTFLFVYALSVLVITVVFVVAEVRTGHDEEAVAH